MEFSNQYYHSDRRSASRCDKRRKAVWLRTQSERVGLQIVDLTALPVGKIMAMHLPPPLPRGLDCIKDSRSRFAAAFVDRIIVNVKGH